MRWLRYQRPWNPRRHRNRTWHLQEDQMSPHRGGVRGTRWTILTQAPIPHRDFKVKGDKERWDHDNRIVEVKDGDERIAHFANPDWMSTFQGRAAVWRTPGGHNGARRIRHAPSLQISKSVDRWGAHDREGQAKLPRHPHVASAPRGRSSALAPHPRRLGGQTRRWWGRGLATHPGSAHIERVPYGFASLSQPAHTPTPECRRSLCSHRHFGLMTTPWGQPPSLPAPRLGAQPPRPDGSKSAWCTESS